MITCNIVGGLGNQLFQIFATISYAIKHKQLFNFEYKLFTTVGKKRQMYWDTFFISLKPFTYAKENIKIMPIKIVNESMVTSLNKPLSNECNCLNGYFQNETYFKEYYETICKMIRLDKQKQDIMGLCEYNFTDSISMHFRQGDYLSLPEHYIILPYEYYRKSLTHTLDHTLVHCSKEDSKIGEKLGTVYYFCEADDSPAINIIIEQLKEEFPQVEFCEVDSSLEDWQQLLIMSCCQHNIIANSTFSWWGAYFNSNPDKIVCTPAQWFGPKINIKMEELIPDRWTKVSTHQLLSTSA
jgi:hypothetical protein